MSAFTRVLPPLVLALLVGCDIPQATVVFENRYPPSKKDALVVYRAVWQAVSVTDPVAPGASSAPEPTLPASSNTAYVLLARGWDPTSSRPPSSLIPMQSRSGFAVELGDPLVIPIDDETFLGNCAARHPLTREQGDFLTRIVFAGEFAGLRYDASTCTTTAARDAGAD